jgi:hypothetical protein
LHGWRVRESGIRVSEGCGSVWVSQFLVCAAMSLLRELPRISSVRCGALFRLHPLFGLVDGEPVEVADSVEEAAGVHDELECVCTLR